MIGGVVFSGGLFLFGWTSCKSIPWIAPCMGAGLMGFGFFTVFQSSLNYLIDTFWKYSWASSVFGFFSIVLIPIPFLFYIYGPWLRTSVKYWSNMS